MFSCTCVCVPCACLVPREAMEDFRFPETEIQRFVNYHVLMGTKAGLRATSALHCWDISPVPGKEIFKQGPESPNFREQLNILTVFKLSIYFAWKTQKQCKTHTTYWKKNYLTHNPCLKELLSRIQREKQIPQLNKRLTERNPIGEMSSFCSPKSK